MIARAIFAVFGERSSPDHWRLQAELPLACATRRVSMLRVNAELNAEC
jgi:hypothetical protein